MATTIRNEYVRPPGWRRDLGLMGYSRPTDIPGVDDLGHLDVAFQELLEKT